MYSHLTLDNGKSALSNIQVKSYLKYMVLWIYDGILLIIITLIIECRGRYRTSTTTNNGAPCDIIYIYIYVNFYVIYKNVNIYINIYIKNKTFILSELYFGFFQTFEDLFILSEGF